MMSTGILCLWDILSLEQMPQAAPIDPLQSNEIRIGTVRFRAESIDDIVRGCLYVAYMVIRAIPKGELIWIQRKSQSSEN